MTLLAEGGSSSVERAPLHRTFSVRTAEASRHHGPGIDGDGGDSIHPGRIAKERVA
jgi:hypothetical protein